jgi:hypothetical protein
MTRNWLAQANVSVDRFHGYLNDPYKIVSVIDSTGGPAGYVYENRPDSRTRRSVYLENRVGWRASSATVSFRYMTDTWGCIRTPRNCDCAGGMRLAISTSSPVRAGIGRQRLTFTGLGFYRRTLRDPTRRLIPA